MFAVCNATRTCLAKADSACVQHGLGRKKARFSQSVNKNKLKKVNFWKLDGRHVTKNAWIIPKRSPTFHKHVGIKQTQLISSCDLCSVWLH